MREILKKMASLCVAFAAASSLVMPAQAASKVTTKHTVSAKLANVAREIAARYGGVTANSVTTNGIIIPGPNPGPGYRTVPRMTALTCDFDNDGTISAFYTSDRGKPVFEIDTLGNDFPDFAGAIIDGVLGVPFLQFTWQPKDGSEATDCGPAVILVGIDSARLPVIGIAFAGEGSSLRDLPGAYFQESFTPSDFFYITGTPTGTITTAVMAFGVLADCGPQTDIFANVSFNNRLALKNFNPLPCLLVD